MCISRECSGSNSTWEVCWACANVYSSGTPSLNYTVIGSWELEYLLFKSYYSFLQNAGMVSARTTSYWIQKACLLYLASFSLFPSTTLIISLGLWVLVAGSIKHRMVSLIPTSPEGGTWERIPKKVNVPKFTWHVVETLLFSCLIFICWREGLWRLLALYRCQPLKMIL